MWISKGPKQILEGLSIEIYYKFYKFGGLLGPQVKFHKDLIGFSGARGPNKDVVKYQYRNSQLRR